MVKQRKTVAKAPAGTRSTKTPTKKAASKRPHKKVAKKRVKKATKKKKTKKKASKTTPQKKVAKKKVAKKKATEKAAKRTPATKRAAKKKSTKKTMPKKGTRKGSAKSTRVSTSAKIVTKGNTPDATKAAYARANRAYRKYFDELRALRGVVGLSVGARFKDGKPTDEFAVRLHVRTEADKQRLKTNPDKYGLQSEYGGVPSDIVVWNFQTGSNGGELPDGTCIRGGGGNGTLGTKVFLREDGIRTGVWLTAAHVVSRAVAPPPSPVDMFLCTGGNRIGTVGSEHYFRNEELDAALIVPSTPLGVLPTQRLIRDVRQSNVGEHASIKGARNESVGIIDSLDYDGPVSGPGGVEQVVDHFLVRPDTGVFAESGDSGAVVSLGNDFGNVLIGQLRAVDDSSGVAVVTRLTVVRRKTHFKL